MEFVTGRRLLIALLLPIGLVTGEINVETSVSTENSGDFRLSIWVCSYYLPDNINFFFFLTIPQIFGVRDTISLSVLLGAVHRRGGGIELSNFSPTTRPIIFLFYIYIYFGEEYTNHRPTRRSIDFILFSF